jgi:hypothetical protein
MLEAGPENCTIELVLDFPCESREELAECENIFIQRYKTDPLCLNMRNGYITPEERLTYHKNYREQRVPCTCGATLTAGNIATHRRTRKHREGAREGAEGL